MLAMHQKVLRMKPSFCIVFVAVATNILPFRS